MLYFSTVEGFSSANPYVEMCWNGYTVPEATINRDLLKFNVKTFAIFTRGNVGPDMAYHPVNDFLKYISLEDQKEITTAFILMHLEIATSSSDVNYIEELENKLGNIINLLDERINLTEKITTYIKQSDIPISDMAEAGTRVQDTPEMTFKYEDALQVTTIAILMKLLSPITGAFIDKYSKLIDNDFKESHAQAIMLSLFSRKWKYLIIKLRNYVQTLIANKLKKDDPTSWFNGHTLERVTTQILDTLLIKRFVGVDLYREDGNIIKYIASCCRSGADSQQRNASMNNSVRVIQDPIDLDKDEGNASRIESESKQSIRPADVPVIVKVAAIATWKKLIQEENLDPDLVESVFAYYRRNVVSMNPISVYLLCTFYGQDIGGGVGIMMLNSTIVSQLAAILQIIAVKKGIPLIAHALTMTVGLASRVPQQDDYIFMNTWKTSAEYTSCKKLFPSGFGEKDWDAKLKDIASFLMEKNVVYNTAPAVWELMNEEPKNGQTFTDFKELMFEIMNFIQVIFSYKNEDMYLD